MRRGILTLPSHPCPELKTIGTDLFSWWADPVLREMELVSMGDIYRRADEWTVRGQRARGLSSAWGQRVPKTPGIGEQVAYCIACTMQGSPQRREFLQTRDLTLGSNEWEAKKIAGSARTTITGWIFLFLSFKISIFKSKACVWVVSLSPLSVYTCVPAEAIRGHQIPWDSSHRWLCAPQYGCWEHNSSPSARKESALNPWTLSLA